MPVLTESVIESPDWQLATKENTPVSLVVQQRAGGVHIFPWMRFVWAEGDNNTVKLAFASHVVTIKGQGLAALLVAVAAHAGIAITFGLIVMSMIYSLGNISGAHLNPAVSIAFAVAGRFNWRQLPGYVGSQLIGALLASLTLKFMFPANVLLGATMPAGAEMFEKIQ